VLTIGMAYFLAAVVASGIFVVAGWRSNKARGLVETQDRHDLLRDPLWADAEIDIDASQAQADVGAAIRLALKRLAPVMASQSVRADVAAPSGLPVRMRGAALADLLEELLTAAIHGAPASRLLLTAATHGDRVHVSITDDLPGADPAVRLGSLRGLMEDVAMRGGALDVDVRPAEGTTMTLRLAAATDEPQDKTERPPSEPAKELSGWPGGSSRA
jgi:hypothetical protein